MPRSRSERHHRIAASGSGRRRGDAQKVLGLCQRAVGGGMIGAGAGAAIGLWPTAGRVPPPVQRSAGCRCPNGRCNHTATALLILTSNTERLPSVHLDRRQPGFSIERAALLVHMEARPLHLIEKFRTLDLTAFLIWPQSSWDLAFVILLEILRELVAFRCGFSSISIYKEE